MQKRNNTWLYVALAGLVGVWLLGSAAPHFVKPATPSTTPTGPDLVAVFNTGNPDEARKDAAIFARLCDSIAGYIERDGGRQQPRLTKAVQLDDFRWRSREEVLDRNGIAAKYPRFRDAVKTYLESKLPDVGSDPVDKPGTDAKTLRQRWVEAYRSLASSARYAMERL